MIKHVSIVHIIYVCFFLSFILSGCSEKITKNSVPKKNKTDVEHLFEKVDIKIFIGGDYIDIEPDTFPEPMQGTTQFYKDMYREIRYPATAREKSIQGSVLFEILIDENGSVKQISKLKSLYPPCDTEAEKAIRKGCRLGFKPYYYKGERVKVQYFMPVNFRLE